MYQIDENGPIWTQISGKFWKYDPYLYQFFHWIWGHCYTRRPILRHISAAHPRIDLCTPHGSKELLNHAATGDLKSSGRGMKSGVLASGHTHYPYHLLKWFCTGFYESSFVLGNFTHSFFTKAMILTGLQLAISYTVYKWEPYWLQTWLMLGMWLYLYPTLFYYNQFYSIVIILERAAFNLDFTKASLNSPPKHRGIEWWCKFHRLLSVLWNYNSILNVSPAGCQLVGSTTDSS